MPVVGRRARRSIALRRLSVWPVVFALAASLLPAPGNAQQVESPSAGPILEEITVTARKIEEDIFDVPMSVQVLSGDFVAATDPSNLFELQFDVPSLVVTSAGFFGAGVALRGVGGGGGAVASHVNGVYLAQSSLALSRLFDVERVEVLKGPQGTLYGRNSTGGSMNVITRPPEDELGAAVETAVGSFETIRARGHVNLPLDQISLRVALTASEGDGFIRNSIDERTFADQDYVGARLSLRARPAERLSLSVVAERVEDDGASNELWLPPRDYLLDPSDVTLTTVTLANPFLTITNDLVTLDLTYDLDGMTLRSISGYARNVTRGLDDCAGLPPLRGCVRGVDPDRHEQRSQELRLQSRTGASFEWLLGIYALDTDAATRFRLKLLGPTPINDYLATVDETAFATFGQATQRLSERWSVTGGLRLSRDATRVSNVGTGLGDSPTLLAEEGSWRNTSWRIGMERAFADHGLLYASVATGFKSGGITTERLPSGELDDFDAELLTAYEAGINLRPPGGPWTLRGSVFSYDFEDLQVRTFALIDGDPKLVVDNAAAARIYGVDLSAAMQVGNRLGFSGAVVWMPKREFVEFTSAVTGTTLAGNTLNRAPEWSAAMSFQYSWPVRDIGILSTRLEYDYRSDFFFTSENEPGYFQDAFGLVNLFARIESLNANWYAFASARNLRDEQYLTQAFLQSSPGYPANYEMGFGWRF